MVWTAWRALGAFAALLTATMMVALGEEMREILFTPDTHGYSVAHTALLAAALVFLTERAGRRGRVGWPLLVGLGAPLIALSAVGATDQLFEFVALPSLALAGCLALLPGLIDSLRGGRAWLATAVTVFAFLVAADHLIEGTPPALGPSRGSAYEILDYVRAQGADHGYAPYWDAPVLTWQTHAALKAYPAIPYGAGLHPFPFNQVSSWYTPAARVHTFLVTDSRTTVPESFSTAPATLGTPAGEAVFGTYTVYIYDHDIAEDLG